MDLELALRILDTCDLEKDDCHLCPLFRRRIYDVGVMGRMETNACQLLRAARDVLKDEASEAGA